MPLPITGHSQPYSSHSEEAGQPDQRAILSGLSSTPSQLQSSLFDEKDCIEEYIAFDCIESFFKECLAFLKRLFPCFFATEVTPAQGRSTAILEERVSKGKELVQHQLRVEQNDDRPEIGTPSGFSSDILNGYKVVVVLKYKNKVDVCYHQMQSADSLNLLKGVANAKIEALVRYYANSEDHGAKLSVTTLALGALSTSSRRTGYRPEETIQITTANLEKQSYYIDFYPNITTSIVGYHGRNVEEREDVMRPIANEISSYPELVAELEDYLYNQ